MPLMSSLLSRKIRETGFSFESYDLFANPREKKHDKMLHVLCDLRTFATQKEIYGFVL